MKVSELEGRMLDAWVARAEGFDVRTTREGETLTVHTRHSQFVGYIGGGYLPQWSPSTDPAQGQPIMERERIATTPTNMFPNDVRRPAGEATWTAYLLREGCQVAASYMGPTMLVAAMRFRVAMAFGAEVSE